MALNCSGNRKPKSESSERVDPHTWMPRGSREQRRAEPRKSENLFAFGNELSHNTRRPSEARRSEIHSRRTQPRYPERGEVKMLLFKRLLTSCILFLLLSLAALTGIGMAVGMHGGWYRPPIRSI